jgi:flagellar biogenesis protein FliO
MEIRPIPFPLRATGKPAPGSFSRWIVLARGGLDVFWRALISRARARPKSLALVESSALGDRRFVSVVQFERQRFLIGSSPSSVTLLAQLPDAAEIARDASAPAADEEGQSR